MQSSATDSAARISGTPERRFYTGRDLSRALTIADLRVRAHRRLPRFALEYLEGGAEEEATLERNLKALAVWHFAPQALRDVAQRDLSTVLFGRRLAMPVLVAPTGLNGVFWAGADRALAEAAAGAGIPFVQSTMSNMAVEEVAKVPGLRHWWQLYVLGDRNVQKALIGRVDRAGCEALVITTDAQIYGNREWSRRLSYSPGRLTWSTKLDAALHPGWFATTLLPQGMPSFPNIIDFVPEERRGFFDSAFWAREQMDKGLSWDDVARIRDLWPRRLLVKGLLRVEDVERAMAVGVDGVILSNHGGRQLDWAVSGTEVLPEARRLAGDRLTILADGGVRRGSDVLKCLALGADAVLVGRATLYGVAAAGRDGAARALDILRDETDRAMGLLGASSVLGLGPELLQR